MNLNDVRNDFNRYMQKEEKQFSFSDCRLSIADGIHPAKDVKWLNIDFQNKSVTLVASENFLEVEEHSLADLLSKLLADPQYGEYKVLLKRGIEYSDIVGVLVGQPIFFVAKNKRLLEVENWYDKV